MPPAGIILYYFLNNPILRKALPAAVQNSYMAAYAILPQGNIKLVHEASIERGLLLRNAPHLVKNQTFIIPVYSNWNRFKFTIGLKLYDWVAGSLSLGSSIFISRTETIQKLPNIITKGLLGGVLYHDGQFDDSRLWPLTLCKLYSNRADWPLIICKVTSLIKDDGQQHKLE